MHIVRHIIIAILAISFAAGQGVAKELSTARPEKVGMSPERLEAINSTMQKYVDSGKFAGVVTMISRRGKVVHFEKFGKMDLEADKDMRRDTLFRIYSMSKPITTVAAMILYEKGAFQLSDPVSKYIPQLKDVKVLVNGIKVEQEREFTIKNLMSHTAGLTYGFGDTTIDRKYRDDEIMQSKDLKEMVERLSKVPLQYQPGTRWHYSAATDVLGYLIEVVSGMPFDRFLEEHLFGPLEMNDTFFQVPTDKIDRFGTNHAIDAETGKLKVIDKPKTSQYAKDVTRFSGGGGLISTATDYMRFCQMMLNGGKLNDTQILSPKTIELMTANHLSQDMLAGSGVNPGLQAIPGTGFGLGFGIVTDIAANSILGSDGLYWWGGAAGTIFWVDPKEELAAVAMIQLMGGREVPLKDVLQVLTYSAIVD